MWNYIQLDKRLFYVLQNSMNIVRWCANKKKKRREMHTQAKDKGQQLQRGRRRRRRWRRWSEKLSLYVFNIDEYYYDDDDDHSAFTFYWIKWHFRLFFSHFIRSPSTSTFSSVALRRNEVAKALLRIRVFWRSIFDFALEILWCAMWIFHSLNSIAAHTHPHRLHDDTPGSATVLLCVHPISFRAHAAAAACRICRIDNGWWHWQ